VQFHLSCSRLQFCAMYHVKRKVLDENETLESINQSGEPKKRV